jgi:ferritin
MPIGDEHRRPATGKEPGMMISKKMNGKLNEQVAREFEASHAYLAMSCRLDEMGLKILAAFFSRQQKEERGHALKIIGYIQEVGGRPEVSQIDKPKSDYKTVQSIVEAAVEAELDVTNRINELMNLAIAEKDHATASFLKWFVDEQVEEVSSMRNLLDLVKLAGANVLQVEARIRHDLMAKA